MDSGTDFVEDRGFLRQPADGLHSPAINQKGHCLIHLATCQIVMRARLRQAHQVLNLQVVIKFRLFVDW